jgi:3-deoxy-manno-octulosonate cytidylyltransferase (CMP-KDO synthetase)
LVKRQIISNSVDLHGANLIPKVIAIVPARKASTRLPGKMLLTISGKPLIVNTLERASMAGTVDSVIAATDDEEIAAVVRDHGYEAVLTSSAHESGSDRIAEVARDLNSGSIIVNVQGDEPLISPATIDAAVNAMLADPAVEVCTTSEKIESIGDVTDPNVVKVVCDDSDNAIYFSRSPIPFPRAEALRHGSLENALDKQPELMDTFRKHTGLYVYIRETLLNFTAMKRGKLERTEGLEQLRLLAAGIKIRVIGVNESSIGVDTPDDLERARKAAEALSPASLV